MQHGTSVGSVSSQFYHHRAPFRFTSGAVLNEFTISYETYGKLNADGSNAILLFHALSGSQHAAGFNPSVEGVGELWTEDCQQGWWDNFIGSKRALDTDRYFIICANYLGGCYGSTGPLSLHEDGKPWGARFPHMTVSDVVDSQVVLLDHLGVKTLHAVVGASIGGLMCLNLATRYAERVRYVVSIASGFRTTVLNKLFCFEQVLAIENDPHFFGGNYDPNKPPALGLALARMISHKNFVHLDTIENRARRDMVSHGDQLEWYHLQNNVEFYMLHQGKKFTKRFDANTYLRILEMWSGYDPLSFGQAADTDALFARCKAANQHWLVFTINSDFCFYPEEQAELAELLTRSSVSTMHITVHSVKGHDSFLLEPELYTPHLHFTLGSFFQ